MRLISTRNWNARLSVIWWMSSFLAFGPLQVVLGNGEYRGSIFGNSPILYFMAQGIFVATFSTGVVTLVHWIRKKRNEESQMTK